jgi:hypothetical protein
VSDPDYFRDVMTSMLTLGPVERRRVRFGLTGNGFAPNYEIAPANGLDGAGRVAMSGLSHRRYRGSRDVFDGGRLTQWYDWNHVVGLLKSVVERR